MSSSRTKPAGLPAVDFGPHKITRLIVGGNPFVWNSHFTEKMNRDMEDHFTPEQVVKTLHRCQAAGIDTVQARGDYHRILHYLELFKREGGNLHFIAQTASEMADIGQNIRVLAAYGAIGIYFHGSETDKYWAGGRMDKVRDFLKTIRDTGVQVGLAGHHPEIFDYVEDKGWDLDFYMTPFYDVARNPRESAIVSGKFQEEEFHPDDPERICKFIRATDKLCLAYKILGAGRNARTQQEVAGAFRWAFANIKPGDCVVVGMFPKYEDQPVLDVKYTIEAIKAANNTGN
ncbi:MAG: hypothetical protein U9P14_12540 [Gemmatimonadota bacterium]|nr:hypothetical protein [Gemmatimonadota bacterium]